MKLTRNEAKLLRFAQDTCGAQIFDAVPANINAMAEHMDVGVDQITAMLATLADKGALRRDRAPAGPTRWHVVSNKLPKPQPWPVAALAEEDAP